MIKTYIDIMKDISIFLSNFEKENYFFKTKKNSYEVKYSDFSYTIYVNLPCSSSDYENEQTVMNFVQGFISSFNKQKFRDHVLPRIQSFQKIGFIEVVIRLEVLTAERLYNYSIN